MDQLTRERVRYLLLLVPLTWPGFLYGLWQRRRGLWWSKPRAQAVQWCQQAWAHPAVVPSLGLLGVCLSVSVGIYGAVRYGVPWLEAFMMPTMPIPAGMGGPVIGRPDVLIELVSVATPPWIPMTLGLSLVGFLVGIGTGFVRLSLQMSRWIVCLLVGGLGATGLYNLLTVGRLF